MTAGYRKMAFVFRLFCMFIVFITLGAAQKVPLIFWAEHTYNLQTPHLGQTVSKDTFKNNYIEKIVKPSEQNIVLFIQDKLSLNDITNNADVYSKNSKGGVFDHLKTIVTNYPSAQFGGVEKAADVLNNLAETFQGKVYTLQQPYDITSLDLVNNGSNLIVVQLPKTGSSQSSFRDSLKKIDNIIGSVNAQLETSKQSFAAFYTAEKSSEVLSDRVHMGRHLLESPPNTSESTSHNTSESTFLNLTCGVYMYWKKLNLTTSDGTVFPLPKLTLGSQSKCDGADGADGNQTAIVVAEHKEESLESTFQFRFDIAHGYWRLSTIDLMYNYTNNSATVREWVIIYTNSTIYAPLQFSYHCTFPTPLSPSNNSTDLSIAKSNVSITFEGFQTEFKKNGTDGKGFGRPNDCVGFFSIPILVSLYVILIMLSILSFAIGMIAKITTMDRFDDPKGKTITVNVTE